MTRLLLACAAAIFIAQVASPQVASAQVTTPSRRVATSVRLTPQQWSCLQTRLTNLRQSSADIVRVPLSPCGQGVATRGPSMVPNVNPTDSAPPPPPPPPDTTHAPLYLSKADLDCIERQLPELTRARQVSEIDLTRCGQR